MDSGTGSRPCPQCGTPVEPGALLCPRCGRPNVSTAFAAPSSLRVPVESETSPPVQRAEAATAVPTAEMRPAYIPPPPQVKITTLPEAPPVNYEPADIGDEVAALEAALAATQRRAPEPSRTIKLLGVQQPTMIRQGYISPRTGPAYGEKEVAPLLETRHDCEQKEQRYVYRDGSMEPASIRRINPKTAQRLELFGIIGILGLGHMYAGHPFRGVALMVIWLLVRTSMSGPFPLGEGLLPRIMILVATLLSALWVDISLRAEDLLWPDS